MPISKRCVSQKVSREPTVNTSGKHLPFPSEIRDRIYKNLLTIGRIPATVLRWSSKPPGASPLSILQVSRQTYIEAFHIFYAENCIVFSDTNELFDFLRNIGYARRQQLTTLEFLWEGEDPKQAFRILKTCGNLRSITIKQRYIFDCPPPSWEALREVRGLDEVKIPKAEVHPFYFMAQRRSTIPSILADHASLMAHLEEGMKRPRIKVYSLDPDEKIDLFNRKRETFRKTEQVKLEEETKQLMANPHTWKSSGPEDAQLPNHAGTFAMTASIRMYL